MNRNLLLFIFLFFHAFSTTGQNYLEHINIINVENGNVLQDQFVLIEGNKIKSISSQPIINLTSQGLDCTGKYLIPGLWDMHIHDAGDSFTRYEYIPLFLANGITGIRDMWGSKEMIQLRNEINAGSFVGPRMIVGSPIIDGGKAFFGDALAAATESQGRHFVDSLSAQGYDFIKIYSLIREPVYLAIADECKKKKIFFEGHLPIEIGMEQAIEAGQRSFEHNFNVNRFLSGKEPELLKWSHHYLDTVHSLRDGQFMVHTEPLGIAEGDFHLSPSVLNKMIKNRVAIVPTLTLMQGRSVSGELMAKRTKGLEYLSTEFVQSWTHSHPIFPEELLQSFGAAAKFLMNKGVLILAGTDVNNPFCVPGFGLHQELINLHEAGLTNLQVLQTATINPAKFLFKERDLGTVTMGKLADLLILDGNPLVDISNTQKINAVIVNGKYFSKEDLKQMLDRLRRK